MLLKSVVAFAVVLKIAPVAGSADAKDGDVIQGTWLPTMAELGGKMLPHEVRRDLRLSA